MDVDHFNAFTAKNLAYYNQHQFPAMKYLKTKNRGLNRDFIVILKNDHKKLIPPI